MLDNLPVLLADEEKITSPMEQSSSSNDDRFYFCYLERLTLPSQLYAFRSLADNLNTLRDEIYQLRDQNRNLQLRLEEEISARKRLESITRCNLLQNRHDIEWND